MACGCKNKGVAKSTPVVKTTAPKSQEATPNKTNVAGRRLVRREIR